MCGSPATGGTPGAGGGSAPAGRSAGVGDGGQGGFDALGRCAQAAGEFGDGAFVEVAVRDGDGRHRPPADRHPQAGLAVGEAHDARHGADEGVRIPVAVEGNRLPFAGDLPLVDLAELERVRLAAEGIEEQAEPGLGGSDRKKC